jgi:hypothetical protein
MAEDDDEIIKKLEPRLRFSDGFVETNKTR